MSDHEELHMCKKSYVRTTYSWIPSLSRVDVTFYALV